MTASRKREDQVTPRVHVVDRDQQLAKSRLPQVLGEQFDVLPRELLAPRRSDRRGAANQVPQVGRAAGGEGLAGQRRAEQPPQQPAPRPAPYRIVHVRPHQRGGQDRGGDQQRKQHEPRHDRRQRQRREQRIDPAREAAGQTLARPFETDERQHQADEAGQDGGGEQRDRQEENEAGGEGGVAGHPQRRAPAVESPGGGVLPDPARLPEPRPAVDRGEQRRGHADPTAADEIDLDPGLVQGSENAGVVRPRGAGSREQQRRAQPRRVGPVRGVRRDHARAPSSSCSVTSFTISKRRLPFGAVTLTSSPSSLFTSARPIGEAVEIIPSSGSASSGITSW